MLSVIVEADGLIPNLPGMLAQLTPAAVDGLVTEVFVVAEPTTEVTALCDDMGAEEAHSVEVALAWAKEDRVLVVPADLRLRPDWIERLRRQLEDGATQGVATGLSEGLLAARPYGVLVERRRALAVERPDLKRLRRQLGLRPGRIG